MKNKIILFLSVFTPYFVYGFSVEQPTSRHYTALFSPIHCEITKEALSNASVISSSGKRGHFSNYVIENELCRYNENQDWDQTPLFHFDNEIIRHSMRYLVNERQNIQEILRGLNPKSGYAERVYARNEFIQKLGRMLHTIQDFYSHTNAINVPNLLVDVESYGKIFTKTNLDVLIKDLNLGYDVIEGSYSNKILNFNSCNRYYNNLNTEYTWDIPTSTVLTGAYFTTVYDEIISPISPEYISPLGYIKCRHGSPFKQNGGINKDTPKRGHEHYLAFYEAKAYTLEFVERLLLEIQQAVFFDSNSQELGDEMLCYILGHDEEECYRFNTSQVHTSQLKSEFFTNSDGGQELDLEILTADDDNDDVKGSAGVHSFAYASGDSSHDCTTINNDDELILNFSFDVVSNASARIISGDLSYSGATFTDTSCVFSVPSGTDIKDITIEGSGNIQFNSTGPGTFEIAVGFFKPSISEPLFSYDEPIDVIFYAGNTNATQTHQVFNYDFMPDQADFYGLNDPGNVSMPINLSEIQIVNIDTSDNFSFRPTIATRLQTEDNASAKAVIKVDGKIIIKKSKLAQP